VLSPTLACVETLTAEAIIARISEAHAASLAAGKRGIVAFDGDGTLWSGDVGEDFFEAVVAAGRFVPVSVDAMLAVGRAAALPGMDAGRTDGKAVARALFEGYLQHHVAEDVICEVIASMCAGWREQEVAELALSVVRDLEPRRHLELRGIVDWARRHDVEAFLVSASPRPVVEAAGAAWGFDRAHVLATTAPFVDGVMQATVVRPIPYGPGKLAQLEAHLEGRTLLAAFGDNVFDVPMLEAARVAVAVAPKQRLLAELERRPALQPVLLRTRTS
jgi:phosphatidylglycerophosphatase C